MLIQPRQRDLLRPFSVGSASGLCAWWFAMLLVARDDQFELVDRVVHFRLVPIEPPLLRDAVIARVAKCPGFHANRTWKKKAHLVDLRKHSFQFVPPLSEAWVCFHLRSRTNLFRLGDEASELRYESGVGDHETLYRAAQSQRSAAVVYEASGHRLERILTRGLTEQFLS